jgi:type I restriction enzyme S subunit
MGQSQSHKAQNKKGLFPQLRFKGFDGEWDNRRLDEVFSIFNGYAFSSAQSQESGCRWVKIADVGINEINHDSTSFLPIEFKVQYPKYLLKEGDFIVALTRPILNGRLKISKVDKALDGSLLNQRVGKLISGNDLVFVYSILQRESLIASIENRIAGTDPPNLSPSAINSLNLSIPSLPEQQKIAAFLSAVDEKIQLLTRKKEALERYKKGVMQQLFSGKLRFKDENGKAFPKWEEKRLGEIADIYQPKTISQSELIDIGYDVYGANGIIGKYNKFNHELSQIAVTCRGSTCGVVNYTNPKSWITGNAMVINVDNSEIVNKKFLYYHLFITNLSYLITGSGQPQITGAIKSHPVFIPSINEQQKIASYLSGIDTKLERVSSQITEAQTFKKGLLQHMFV